MTATSVPVGNNMEPTLLEILDAREQRVRTQEQLLHQYGKPLICFTMNIPGPVKVNRDVLIGFFVGCRLLEDSLAANNILYRRLSHAHTGCEGYYVVDMPADALKKLTMELEDIYPIGRLFDMDVLDTDGKKLERPERRKCLLCDQDAVICASSRSHTVEQLQDRTGFLLYLCARQYLTELIAVHAYFALNQEVSTTPKPGLVDRNNRGSHRDMGIKHFFASANALRPYFCRCAEIGFLTRDLPAQETFRQIREEGVQAEKTMLDATRGVNTHKGAIFSLGILCAAAGRVTPQDWQLDTLLAQCSAMTLGITARDLGNITAENAATAGEKLYARYGITGIRGQAEAGFPAVRDAGVPILRRALSQGLSLNDAGAVTLLHLLAATDDTNLIHRGGREKQLQIREEIAALLQTDPFPSMETISRLDGEFIAENLSPGGSADLLALTLFLHGITP